MKRTRRAGRWPAHIATAAVLALFASGLFSRCANVRGSLQGGEKDTLPPRVTGMTPRFNATDTRPERIYITFDEYVQLKDLQTEFFTSPLLLPNPKVRIKKKGILIEIEAPLEDNTTYVMNLGSSVVDNNEGNPYHALKYTFSTGPHIDSMIMSGFAANTFTGDTIKGAYVLFYNALDDLPGPDSLLYDLYRARAVAKTMSSGGFIFSNLQPIDYKIYAMLDNNGNTMYDPGVDEVAFLDSLYNPTEMPSFMMWYDSTRMYPVAEPQIFFDTFIENPDRQQNLSSSARVAAQQIMLRFSAPNPKIDTFELQGIDPRYIITEQARPERDSVLYWIDLPPEEVPDTILGRIVYDRPDSAGVIAPYGQDLRLIHNRPAPPPEPEIEDTPEIPVEDDPEIDSLRAQGLLPPLDSIETVADSVPPSPMVFQFSLPEPIVPQYNLRLDFELPVIRFDTASVRLFRPAAAAEAPQAPAETEVPFTVSADSMHIREFTFRADWVDGVSYRLLIPAGAIETIDREVNDTIDHTFAVADREKLGTLTLIPMHADPESEYLVQVTDTAGRTILRELTGLTGDDSVTIRYLTPGKVKLRLVEDRNRNRRWDTGIVVQRVQPEKVRWYYDGADKTDLLTLAEKTEVQVEVDLTQLFQPRVHRSSYESESAEEQEPVEAGQEQELDPEHDHGEPGHVHDHGAGTAYLPETEIPAEAVLAEPRVETFELLDRAADKKARKEAKREARRQHKEEQRRRREQMKEERQAHQAEERI